MQDAILYLAEAKRSVWSFSGEISFWGEVVALYIIECVEFDSEESWRLRFGSLSRYSRYS